MIEVGADECPSCQKLRHLEKRIADGRQAENVLRQMVLIAESIGFPRRRNEPKQNYIGRALLELGRLTALNTLQPVANRRAT